MGFLIVDNDDYMHRPLGDGAGDTCCQCHIKACENNRHKELQGSRTAPEICELIETNTYESHIRAEMMVNYAVLVACHDTETGCIQCDHFKTIKAEDHEGMICDFPEEGTHDRTLYEAGTIQDRDAFPVAGMMRRRLDDRLDAVNMALRIKHGIVGGERSLVGYDRDRVHSQDMQQRFEQMGDPLPKRVGVREAKMRTLIKQMKADGEI